jgi:hypothetical protein
MEGNSTESKEEKRKKNKKTSELMEGYIYFF